MCNMPLGSLAWWLLINPRMLLFQTPLPPPHLDREAWICQKHGLLQKINYLLRQGPCWVSLKDSFSKLRKKVSLLFPSPPRSEHFAFKNKTQRMHKAEYPLNVFSFYWCWNRYEPPNQLPTGWTVSSSFQMAASHTILKRCNIAWLGARELPQRKPKYLFLWAISMACADLVQRFPALDSWGLVWRSSVPHAHGISS